MGKLSPSLITILIVLSAIIFENSYAKPAATTVLETGTDPVLVEINNQDVADSLLRDQRSPGYGFGDYDQDYYDGESSRHYTNKHKHHHGCRTHGCGGGSYHKPSHHGGGGGGSFASASAGSIGTGNHHGGSNSQAQAASLSFGPISISTAQSQSFGGFGSGFGRYDY